MKHVEIFRAEGVVNDDVQEVTIGIRVPMPDRMTAEQARRFHASEGAALAEAIWSSCPGGTVDALIASLLARRASLLRVTFPRTDGGDVA